MPACTSARTGSSARAPRVLAALLTAVLALLAGALSLAAAGPASAATCLTCGDGGDPAPRPTTTRPTSPVPTPSPTASAAPALQPILTRGPQTDWIDGDSDQVMTTSVTWVRSTGTFTATTRITNHAYASGFTGGVVVLAVDAAGRTVGSTQPQQWGVDCNAFYCSGPTDRTLAWSGQLTGVPATAASLTIVQWHWGKNRFLGDFAAITDRLRTAVVGGEMTAQVVALFH
ncbi:hypothetical protein EV189_2494 [Motilibacter rhizosphaerae]|uniref:Uncharacterized protein n=1 Tax=Motilibacter rhizosphaerae TaxID=598652 RepID=A0A4Q7NPQ4_9ACTN|nr:hypothetical protein [Motilibacter rhizosphaerae]RZS87072.1 hypothetical protein EV189_2494 [Motilibacter rhizosphaerae]